MLHHVEIYVRDLELSISFWTPFMGPLGYEEERWPRGGNCFLGERTRTSPWCRRRANTAGVVTTAGESA